MDELPPQAKRLLELARDAHDCEDSEARRRVRRAVAGATGADLSTRVEAQPGAVVSGASGPLTGLAGKLAATVLSVLVVTGGVLLATREPGAPPDEAVSARPHAVALSSAEQPAQPVRPPVAAEEPREEPKREVAAKGRSVSRRGPDTLRDEVQSLREVERALALDESASARALLERHRSRFRTPVMREELRAFEVLVSCAERAPNAQTRAARFLARHPRSVFAERVRGSCPAR